MTRRDLIKGATAAVASTQFSRLAEASEADPTSEAKSMINVPFERRDKVRLGIIGVGGRGQGVMSDFMGVEGVEVRAICDIVPDRLKESQAQLQKAGKPRAAEYGTSETDYKRLCARDDLDFIYIATPWKWHAPMAIDSMNEGKHCGVEVPVVTSIKDAWAIVDTSEKTRRHCMIMENCCYGYNELMVLNMVRKGLFGTLTHGEAAYIHDLRSLLLEDAGEGLWRRFPHIDHNGNLYPTHGLGPVSNYMGVNRGDKFNTIVSLSSREAGLTEYRDKHLPAGDPKRKEKYRCGDMNTSILRTDAGLTVMLQHEVTSPRPYTRLNMIQGTEGVFTDYPAKIYIEGRSKNDAFEPIDSYKAEFEHDLWRKSGDLARKMGGHGGMDFLMCFRVIECFKNGTPPDMDVYDAAAWSAPGPLSEISNAKGGAPQKFPDFTRGKWRERKGTGGI
ncbi:MAG: Gfo/Idh/MocA family protein [Fimbriimonas sp.]